jgi:hypothetical protein
MLKFTEDEIARRSELRALVTADPKSPDVPEWNAELRQIVSAAHTRMVQRAEQRRAKADVKAEDGAVEVVKPEDMLSSDELAESQESQARIQELRNEIAAATREKRKADLQDELTYLLDCEGQLGRRAERRAIKAGKCLPTPKREDCFDYDDFEETMEWHRLNLAEAACYRKMNSGKTSFNLRRDVEKELSRINQQRQKLRPDEFEPEPKAESADTPTPELEKPAPSTDFSKLADKSDVALREALSKQQFLRDQIGVTDNGPLIAALEAEIQKRSK